MLWFYLTAVPPVWSPRPRVLRFGEDLRPLPPWGCLGGEGHQEGGFLEVWNMDLWAVDHGGGRVGG